MPTKKIKQRFINDDNKECCMGCDRTYTLDYMLEVRNSYGYACIYCYNKMKAELERNRDYYAKEGDTTGKITTRIFESFKASATRSKNGIRYGKADTLGTIAFDFTKKVRPRTSMVNGAD